ncbi:alpha/beta fold hydrolase [Lysobacter sp. GX 14042]|uniref:esterase/lipase family protein n=1 Tax=Lysobacter sp. GX 14042 TaxID=2907155 RepID=UPI001F27169B|nr:alpha/beta fold hydrolase [Lysobacter sp. GX 14042]MCE7031441.1 alpha/beta fold hydrolase [Lysobacter sp. GX 14042]
MSAARLPRAMLLALAMLLLGGCAVLNEFRPAVEARPLSPGEYIALKRGDILTTGKLSAATAQTIRVSGLETGACAEPSRGCIQALGGVPGLSDERRLSAQAELWVQQAILLAPAKGGPVPDVQIDAWLEAARHAYAYLFFTGRAPGERAFEDRQTQVRDYYNHAVQQGAIALFQRSTGGAPAAGPGQATRVADWAITTDLSGIRMPPGADLPRELLPASSLEFAGLRSTYRRDGFGAELVAVMREAPAAVAAVQALNAAEDAATGPPDGSDDTRHGPRRGRPRVRAYSEMPSPSLTVLFHFAGAGLADILATREVHVSAHDPYRESEIALHGQDVPLAANYTAGYGLWLARSGFARQSLQTLFGRGQAINRAHVYLMQPYDPDRRIIVMVHGLASSPEAWVNVANEILGDETLRRSFQVWQVYYPTNLPIAYNHAALRRVLGETLQSLDPTGSARASRDIVLVGHSMGGVLSRLLVSSSGDRLWDEMLASRKLDDGRLERVRGRLEPMLRFEPFPGVERAILIAAPHRGTDAANNRLGRLISRLIRLPLTVLESFDDVLQALAGAEPDAPNRPKVPNSIDNLSREDPFIRASADLPISPRVRYHTIIARRDPAVPLEVSDDGLVPYCSAHLAGAVSEKVIESFHSVQETPEAILEIRRILHADLQGGDGALAELAPPTGVCAARPEARGHPAPSFPRKREATSPVIPANAGIHPRVTPGW